MADYKPFCDYHAPHKIQQHLRTRTHHNTDLFHLNLSAIFIASAAAFVSLIVDSTFC